MRGGKLPKCSTLQKELHYIFFKEMCVCVFIHHYLPKAIKSTKIVYRSTLLNYNPVMMGIQPPQNSTREILQNKNWPTITKYETKGCFRVGGVSIKGPFKTLHGPK